MADKSDECLNVVNTINKDTDMRVFIDDHRSKGEIFKEKQFISFEQSESLERNRSLSIDNEPQDLIDFTDDDETVKMNQNREFVFKSVKGLFDGVLIPKETQLKIFELLH